MDVQEAIRKSYVANGMTEAQLELLYPLAEMRTFEKGEDMMRQYEKGSDLMVLASGKATIKTNIGEQIAVLKPGMPFGEVSLIDEKVRSATVTADERCEVVVLPAEPLRALMLTNPDIAMRALLNISRVLCQRLRQANNQMMALMAIEEANHRR